MTLAAHTVVKNIVDYANNIFGTFSTVAQSLVASELGRVGPGPRMLMVALLVIQQLHQLVHDSSSLPRIVFAYTLEQWLKALELGHLLGPSKQHALVCLCHACCYDVQHSSSVFYISNTCADCMMHHW